MKKGMALLIALAFCLSLATIAQAEVSNSAASPASSAVSASSSNAGVPKMAWVKKAKKRAHKQAKKIAPVTKKNEESSETK